MEAAEASNNSEIQAVIYSAFKKGFCDLGNMDSMPSSSVQDPKLLRIGATLGS